jgi:hypothetical protein
MGGEVGTWREECPRFSAGRRCGLDRHTFTRPHARVPLHRARRRSPLRRSPATRLLIRAGCARGVRGGDRPPLRGELSRVEGAARTRAGPSPASPSPLRPRSRPSPARPPTLADERVSSNVSVRASRPPPMPENASVPPSASSSLHSPPPPPTSPVAGGRLGLLARLRTNHPLPLVDTRPLKRVRAGLEVALPSGGDAPRGATVSLPAPSAHSSHRKPMASARLPVPPGRRRPLQFEVGQDSTVPHLRLAGLHAALDQEHSPGAEAHLAPTRHLCERGPSFLAAHPSAPARRPAPSSRALGPAARVSARSRGQVTGECGGLPAPRHTPCSPFPPRHTPSLDVSLDPPKAPKRPCACVRPTQSTRRPSPLSPARHLRPLPVPRPPAPYTRPRPSTRSPFPPIGASSHAERCVFRGRSLVRTKASSVVCLSVPLRTLSPAAAIACPSRIFARASEMIRPGLCGVVVATGARGAGGGQRQEEGAARTAARGGGNYLCPRNNTRGTQHIFLQAARRRRRARTPASSSPPPSCRPPEKICASGPRSRMSLAPASLSRRRAPRCRSARCCREGEARGPPPPPGRAASNGRGASAWSVRGPRVEASARSDVPVQRERVHVCSRPVPLAPVAPLRHHLHHQIEVGVRGGRATTHTHTHHLPPAPQVPRPSPWRAPLLARSSARALAAAR